MAHRKANKSAEAPTGKTSGFALRGRIWVEGPEGTFLGHGRVVLMERIIEHGSITKAAKSMEMSYRHAWRLIDSMNRQAPKPLVLTCAGGKKGGGTTVTEEGKRAIEYFWNVKKSLGVFLENKDMKYIVEGEQK